MQLTEAEASFRALKSELSVRPLFHQLEPRVKAHVMVAFLGYALWVTLKHLLKRRPSMVLKPSANAVENLQPMTPMRALALLSTLQSADIVLTHTDGRKSACVALPNQRRSRKHSFINWASVCPNIFSSTANVVQTRRCALNLYNGLAQFWPVW